MTIQSFTQAESKMMYAALVRIRDLKTSDLVKYCGRVDEIALDTVIVIDEMRESRAQDILG